MSGVTILCHHLLIIINITNSNKSVDSTSVRWNLHHPYDRALALEEGKVKTLDLVSTAEARATILEARLAGQKCNKVQKWIQNSTHSLIVIAHHPFLPIIISFFHQNITKSNDQVYVKKHRSQKYVGTPPPLPDNSIVSTDCLRSTGQTSWRWLRYHHQLNHHHHLYLIILFMTIINSSNQWIVKDFKSFWMVYFELFTVDYLNHHHYHLHNPHNVQVLQKTQFYRRNEPFPGGLTFFS